MGVVRRTISPHAAQLRGNSTDAEQVLWLQLRGRRLGGHRFRRQWSLFPYVVDFCCWEERLIVELDGGQHTRERDSARTGALEALGFRLLRFWNNDVLGNLEGVLVTILAALGGERVGTEGQEDPHPNPLPRAGEGEEDPHPGPLPQAGEGEDPIPLPRAGEGDLG